MRTEQQAREEFSTLYEEVKADSRKDGGSITKKVLWDQFIENGIEYERFPKDATAWKMPRSTK